MKTGTWMGIATAAALFVSPAGADTVWYAARTAHVRAAPGGDVRYSVGVNTKMIRDRIDGDWWHIRYPVSGWVHETACRRTVNWYAGGIGGRYVQRLAHVRSGPGGNYGPRYTITVNSTVHFDGVVWKDVDSKWVHAVYPVSGWVSAEALGRNPVWTSSHVGGRYAKATLNVRSGPGIRFGVRAQINKDAKVEVDAYLTNGWAHLKWPRAGWVLYSYLTTQAPQPSLRPNSRGFVNCPGSGTGYYSYTSSDRRWGTPRLVYGLITMGRRWSDGWPGPRGRRLSYGDISRAYGGYFPPHQSHQLGVDVDMRLITDSANAEPTTIYSSAYSRYYSTKFVYLQRAVWGGGIMILMNDSAVPYRQYASGHDNHFHTRTY